nr:MAG TPA: hypothetical protein [Caudoviricetes sp.]
MSACSASRSMVRSAFCKCSFSTAMTARSKGLVFKDSLTICWAYPLL